MPAKCRAPSTAFPAHHSANRSARTRTGRIVFGLDASTKHKGQVRRQAWARARGSSGGGGRKIEPRPLVQFRTRSAAYMGRPKTNTSGKNELTRKIDSSMAMKHTNKRVRTFDALSKASQVG